MIDSIKNKIWEIVQEKEISLVMIFKKKGKSFGTRAGRLSTTMFIKARAFSKHIHRR